jgi:phosphoribosylglycinamide formyltransferase
MIISPVSLLIPWTLSIWTTSIMTERRIVVLISGGGPCVFNQTIRYGSVVSDTGSNLQALIDACNTPALPDSRIVLVLSNRKAAYGLERAQNAQPPIPTAYLALQPYLKANPEKTRDDYDAAVADIVVQARPDVVVLAGWMHVLSERFLDVLARKAAALSSGDSAADSQYIQSEAAIPVINLHPALPGAFDGTHAIQRAHEAFLRGDITKSGAMVHRVVKEVDRGAPVVVREVDMREGRYNLRRQSNHINVIMTGEDVDAFESRIHAAEWEIIVEATKIVLDEVKPIA